MSSSPLTNLSLKLKNNNILNCFGIQPVFVENGKIHESFLATVYRQGTATHKTGKVHQLHCYRQGDENDVVLRNCFHISQAEKEVVRLLLNDRTFTYKQNVSLDLMMRPENHDKLKELLLTQFERIKYYTMFHRGNFIITSRTDLYNKNLFIVTEVNNFQIYLVSDTILPKNVLILGHSNNNSFRTPYVACPLIDKQKFDTLCKINDIDLNSFQIDPKKRYPLIDKQLNLYSLYQSYLDNVEVPYWYIETFRNPVKTRQKAYYTTLYFD